MITTIDLIEKYVSGKQCYLYICGDFNVNFLNYDNHSDTIFWGFLYVTWINPLYR